MTFHFLQRNLRENLNGDASVIDDVASRKLGETRRAKVNANAKMEAKGVEGERESV